ncbi:hypothetical protein BC834DRAFT_520148 [Gloeopeniophorella convolvens]|nr:hypothetical protein BC834DRAFT_520148 [Gloeopeniophorella convolvens]
MCVVASRGSELTRLQLLGHRMYTSTYGSRGEFQRYTQVSNTWRHVCLSDPIILVQSAPYTGRSAAGIQCGRASRTSRVSSPTLGRIATTTVSQLDLTGPHGPLLTVARQRAATMIPGRIEALSASRGAACSAAHLPPSSPPPSSSMFHRVLLSTVAERPTAPRQSRQVAYELHPQHHTNPRARLRRLWFAGVALSLKRALRWCWSRGVCSEAALTHDQVLARRVL